MSLVSTLVVTGIAGLLLVLAALLLGELLDGVLDAVLPGEPVPGAVPALGAAVAAFGFGSALALSADVSRAVALVLGVALAAAVAAVSLLALRALLGGGVPPPGDSALYGVFGRVVTPVPASGYGEVVLVVAGSPRKLAAVAERPLPVGTVVHVLDVLTSTSVLVAAVDPSLLEPA